jgi:hypothetical protein
MVGTVMGVLVRGQDGRVNKLDCAALSVRLVSEL